MQRIYRYHNFGATRNAVRAFRKHLEQGKLSQVVKVYGEFTSAKWYRLHVVMANGTKRTYTGFAWWYSGEGSRGLVSCLSLLGIDADFLLSHKLKGDHFSVNGFFIPLKAA